MDIRVKYDAGLLNLDDLHTVISIIAGCSLSSNVCPKGLAIDSRVLSGTADLQIVHLNKLPYYLSFLLLVKLNPNNNVTNTTPMPKA